MIPLEAADNSTASATSGVPLDFGSAILECGGSTPLSFFGFCLSK
jgi:hypothetical protein